MHNKALLTDKFSAEHGVMHEIFSIGSYLFSLQTLRELSILTSCTVFWAEL